jgi:magnesium-transporting ATPase (P-type)
MIEAYAFLGAFTVQILTTSVLYPAWFIRYVRVQTTRLPVERLAQLYPGVDLARVQERFLTRYRALTTGLAVLGSLLLVWLYSYMRRPDWDDGLVQILVTVYFMAAHLLPLGLLIWLGVRFDKEHKRALPPEGKRTAVLQRRGLFDFISPFAVALAVLSYFLFAAFVMYLRNHPFPGFAGLITLGAVTLVYALNALLVYKMLYGRDRNPLKTPAGRQHAIAVTVKSSVYTCIAVVGFLSLNFTLVLLDLKRWGPFVLSVFFVICALLACISVMTSRRQAAAKEIAPVH